MYLRGCLIENSGPIQYLDLTFPFNDNGTPKPVVLVGSNGAGKSIFLSHLADALIELGKIAFKDIVSNDSIDGRPYFRISQDLNKGSIKPYSLVFLRFSDEQNQWFCTDKIGDLESTTYEPALEPRFSGVPKWSKLGSFKGVSTDKEQVEHFFRHNSVCYFPPSRKELPHWLNTNSISTTATFAVEPRYEGLLKKPIFVESSVQENKSWLLDVFLDANLGLYVIDEQIRAFKNIQDVQTMLQAISNVNAILRQIIQDPSAMLATNYRNQSESRLRIFKDSGRSIVPQLEALSSGQAILLNMFMTIIRYSDSIDLSKASSLNDISGIVLIDEIDAHLHSQLQYEVVPALLKLFPKVQFILSSHSPLFLLGMKNTYGEDGFQIIELPTGTHISTERFSEFETSFAYYKSTKAFEETTTQLLKASQKPLILTEGITDADYLKRALQIYGRIDILESVEIQSVGKNVGRDTRGGGSSGLDRVAAIADANPSVIQGSVLLLYDFDVQKLPSSGTMVTIAQVPHNFRNTKIKAGIENLFDPILFTSEFYQAKTEIGNYGEEIQRPSFQKSAFCSHLCKEGTVQDFAEFSKVIAIIDNWLRRNKPGDSSERSPEIDSGTITV